MVTSRLHVRFTDSTNMEDQHKPFTPEQEAFIDSFYQVYESYFLVDDPISYCKRISGLTGKDMMAKLFVITNKAGFILPKQDDLGAFANELVSSCTDGSTDRKATLLKTRFDTAYPY